MPALVKDTVILLDLSWMDFKSRYLGSRLGIFWAFITPAFIGLVLAAVYRAGFKNTDIAGVPYVLWLLPSLFVWSFFAESVARGANSIAENRDIVKGACLRVEFLPVIHVFSALIAHAIAMSAIAVIYIFYKRADSISIFRLCYFMGGAAILSVGISWFFSALAACYKDSAQAVYLGLQSIFWITPIFWPIGILPEKYHVWLKFNPVYYVTEGYRQSFLGESFVLRDTPWTVYFWGFTVACIFLGSFIFSKLKMRFADAL